jgi:hypothetical protein
MGLWTSRLLATWSASRQSRQDRVFENARLRKRYGQGRWRKRKGFAEIRLPSGELVRAELHWYEATGIGRYEMKIKAFI